MEKVVTKDGSITFYNEVAREHYHTLTGAIEEAELKHLAPAKDFIKSNSVIIDFCFGLGYNSIVTLFYAIKNNISGLTFVCFENDLEIINQLAEIDMGKYDDVKNMFLEMINSPDVHNINSNYEYFEKIISGYKFKLFLGDAKELITKSELADVIYFDPFSRRKLPDFWTDEIFEKVYSVLKKPSILTTYSCSKAVRRSMESAGFSIADGPVVGRLAPGTLAFKE